MRDLIKKLKKLSRKEYRDAYMQSRVRSIIAYQIQALRKKFGMSQTEMAQKTGKKQSVISRLEDPDYGGVSLQSLLDIASSLNVALLVQFVSYPDFLKRTADMSESALQTDTIDESINRLAIDQLKPVEVSTPAPVREKRLRAALAYNSWEQLQAKPVSEGALEAHWHHQAKPSRTTELMPKLIMKQANETSWISSR